MALEVSMATQIEDWIIAQLVAIQTGGSPLFEATDVQPWEGTEKNAAREFEDELMGSGRNTNVRVMFLRDSQVPLEGGLIEIKPTYVILVGQKNLRGQSVARRGGDDSGGDKVGMGTNDIRDLFQLALHNKKPTSGSPATVIQANGKVAKICEWIGSTVIIARKNLYIQESTVVVSELPL